MKEMALPKPRMAPIKSSVISVKLPLAERDGVHRARCHVEQAPIIGDRAHDAADATYRRDRRIVGMHRQLDAGTFGDRQHALKETIERTPTASLRRSAARR